MNKSFRLGFAALTVLAFAGPLLASENTPAGADPRLLSAIKKANSEFEVAMTKADIARRSWRPTQKTPCS